MRFGYSMRWKLLYNIIITNSGAWLHVLLLLQVPNTIPSFCDSGTPFEWICNIISGGNPTNPPWFIKQTWGPGYMYYSCYSYSTKYYPLFLWFGYTIRMNLQFNSGRNPRTIMPNTCADRLFWNEKYYLARTLNSRHSFLDGTTGLIRQ